MRCWIGCIIIGRDQPRTIAHRVRQSRQSAIIECCVISDHHHVNFLIKLLIRCALHFLSIRITLNVIIRSSCQNCSGIDYGLDCTWATAEQHSFTLAQQRASSLRRSNNVTLRIYSNLCQCIFLIGNNRKRIIRDEQYAMSCFS